MSDTVLLEIIYRYSSVLLSLCFFFQAEDGIRDRDVTGVQTCALPICLYKENTFRRFLHDNRDQKLLAHLLY